MNGKEWTAADNATLRRLYPDSPTKAIAARLRRPLGNVYARATRMGLRKSAEFLASPAAHRLDGATGMNTRFQRGLTPWNKGCHYVAGGESARTRFKKGHRPQTWVPVGSERLKGDGYRERKVSDTGYCPRDWVGVHRLLWIEHHGAIPAGHAVLFRDGDKTNITIENLEIVSRAELGRRNVMWNRYPRPLCEAIQLRGALVRKINRRQGNEKQD